VFQTRYGSLIPELRVAWKHDYNIDDQVISAAFEGSPNIPFVVQGQELDRDGATVSAGMTFILKNGFSTNLKYDAELSEDYSSHGLFGELRYSF
jgi:outer membrane autotransporter protein